MSALARHIGSGHAACGQCGAGFRVYASVRATGRGRFCSRQCKELALSKHPIATFRGVRYYLTNGYYSRTDGARLHRRVWEAANGPIPAGHLIHHINGIKTDNRIENLELMEWGAHSALENRSRVHKKMAWRGDCRFAGCASELRARGFCMKHYQSHMANIKRAQGMKPYGKKK